jgi:hypothetical protein
MGGGVGAKGRRGLPVTLFFSSPSILHSSLSTPDSHLLAFTGFRGLRWAAGKTRPLDLLDDNPSEARRTAEPHSLHSSSDGGLLRTSLIRLRRRLASNRRTTDDLVGAVGRRFSGFSAARRTSSRSRSRASSRLRSCVLKRRASMTTTPSEVRRRPASRRSLSLTSSGSEGDRRASKRSWTAVATLLTFCPPGPDARTKVSWISLSSRAISSFTRIMSTVPSRRPGVYGRNILGRILTIRQNPETRRAIPGPYSMSRMPRMPL